MDRYNTQIEQIKYTQKGKEILMENVKKSNKTKTKLLKIALVVAMLSTITATAYAVQNPIDILAPIIGSSQAQTEIIGQIGVPINASATSNGITITAEAIIGTKNNTMIVYKLSNEDGSTIELPASADKTALMIDGFGTEFKINSGGTGSSGIKLYEDGYYRLIEKRNTDAELPNGKKVTATFENLSYFNEDGFLETLVNGNWKITYQFSYIDSTENIIVDETFTREGLEFTVKNIDVSPISLNVYYEVNSVPGFFYRDNTQDNNELSAEVEITENSQVSSLYSQETELYLNGLDLILTTKDGEIFDYSNTGGGLTNNTTYTSGHRNKTFDEIIPLDEIASIQVGDVIVDVNF